MFSQLTCEKLGYYVYTLRCPINGHIFYVGKGTGNRVFAHMNDALESETASDKLDYIRSLINDEGQYPIHTIVRHGMDEDTAFEVEGALIDFFGLEDLKNEVNGHGNSERGLMEAEEIEIKYGATPAIITDPVMIVKANHSWDDKNKSVIYENIREDWWVSKDKTDILKYVLVAHRGIVREVYSIHGWMDSHRKNKKGTACKKIFNGVPAKEGRKKYLHKDVSGFFAVPRLQKAYAGLGDK